MRKYKIEKGMSEDTPFSRYFDKIIAEHKQKKTESELQLIIGQSEPKQQGSEVSITNKTLEDKTND